MPKAYWIARVDVSDPETYKKYVETAIPAFQRYNAKFLARGGKTEVLEGKAAPAMSSLSSPPWTTRWPATIRRNTRLPARSARP